MMTGGEIEDVDDQYDDGGCEIDYLQLTIMMMGGEIDVDAVDY